MKIKVLLSTWNGEQYLREQLASLLAQKVDGTIEILIRDDGSVDGTVKIIEEMNDGRINLTLGENLGAKESFMRLLSEACNDNADFIAFADQDDVWLPGKLQRAISKLSGISGPGLYCSALNLVDEKLKPLELYRFVGTPSFEEAFFSNCATGCTCVINREMLKALSAMPNVEAIIMHDWWLYLAAVSLGTVVYDDQSYILYRQHAANHVGMRTGIDGFFYRVRLFLKRASVPSRLSQAREFRRMYGLTLPTVRQQYLARLIACETSLISRLLFVCAHRLRNNKAFGKLTSSVAFVFGG